MTKQLIVICSRCSKILKGSAVCTDCDNKEAAQNDMAFKNLVENIASIIRESQASMRMTVKNSGFSVKNLLKAGLDPEAASFLKSPKKRKKKGRVKVRKK